MIKNILFMLFSLVASFAFAGPESGGGGNVCPVSTGRASTQLTALDLVQSSGVYHWIRLGLRGADQIAFSPAEAQHGIKILQPTPKLMRGVGIVLEDLNSTPDIKNEILNSIRDLKMIAVRRLPAKRALGADFRDTAGKCSAANTTAAIVYDWKIGIVVSAEIWNQLDEANQVALLIHEGLRNIQIRYRYGFSNYALQRLTQDLMTGKTAEFVRFFKAARAHGAVTPAAAKARLCASPKNREIVADLTAWTDNSHDEKPVDPKLLLSTYFSAACKTGRAEDIWNLMDFMLSDLSQEDMWGSWGLTDQDFTEFNHAITNAYYTSFGAQGRNLEKTWSDVYGARVMMWVAGIDIDGKSMITTEEIHDFWTRINQIYANPN